MDAVGAARSKIPTLVAENRASWMRRAQREIGKASGRYEKAIAELEAAREALDGEATLLAWLSLRNVGNAANDSLGGRAGSQALSFTRTLEALQEDRAHLVAHLATVTDPAPNPEAPHGARLDVQGVVDAVGSDQAPRRVSQQ